MDQYCSNLNTHKYPPHETFTLLELETVCKERLQLYRVLLDAELRNLKPYTDKWKSYVNEKINSNGLQTYISLISDDVIADILPARRNDHIAHWILSLCKLSSTLFINFY